MPGTRGAGGTATDPATTTRRSTRAAGAEAAAAATAAAAAAIDAANRAAAAAAARRRRGAASPSPSLGGGGDDAGEDRRPSTAGSPSPPGSAAGGNGMRRASRSPAASADPAHALAAAVAAVSARYPGREAQVRALADALALSTDWPGHVLVHGPPSVGKTAVVRDLLAEAGRRHVYVKCCATMTPKALARQLLDALLGRKRRRANGYAPDVRADSVADLAEFLAPALGGGGGGGGATAARPPPPAIPPTLVVLDDVDALAACAPGAGAGAAAAAGVDAVGALAAAIAAAGAPVGLVLIASPAWGGAPGGTGPGWAPAAGPAGPAPPAASIPFPAYTPADLLAILARDGPRAGQAVPGLPPGTDGPALYAGMLRGCVLPAWGRDDAGVTALRAAAAWLWPRWLAPAVDGRLGGAGGGRVSEGALNAAARPLVRAARAALDAGRTLPTAAATTAAAAATDAVASTGLDLELPYLTKFLVLAAHVAGATPASADRRTFDPAFRGGRRRAGGARVAAARADARAAAAGGRDPVAFSLERLLSIFWHLLKAEGGDGGGKAGAPTGLGAAAQAGDILTQVASLASLGLLACEGGPSSGVSALDGGRWSSLVPDELASRLASNVRVDLQAYMPGVPT